MSLSLHSDVALAETDDGAVLLHQRTGRYWQLNATGLLVLRSLLGGRTHDETAGDLVTHHGAPSGDAYRDVGTLLDQLRAAGLLKEFS